MVRAIVGASFGDEGKGKITDMLAAGSDIVVRFQGGSNAGHTIVNDYGKFALHLLPSGVFYDHITNIIGNGVALNIPNMMKELESLSKLRMRLIGYAIAEDPSSSPLWNRSYLQSAMAAEHGADPKVLDPPLDTDKTIFIGHTPLDKPFHSGLYHLRAVDTGAGHGRSLTVMDMDTGEFWQA